MWRTFAGFGREKQGLWVLFRDHFSLEIYMGRRVRMVAGTAHGASGVSVALPRFASNYVQPGAALRDMFLSRVRRGDHSQFVKFGAER